MLSSPAMAIHHGVTAEHKVPEAAVDAAAEPVGQAEIEALRFEDMYVPAMPPTSTVYAGFGRIVNPTDQDLAITSISSPEFGQPELHRVSEVDGVMKMRKVERFVVPAGGEKVLKPGGDHLMLMQAKASYAVGTMLTLELTADDGTSYFLEIPVTER